MTRANRNNAEPPMDYAHADDAAYDIGSSIRDVLNVGADLDFEFRRQAKLYQMVDYELARARSKVRAREMALDSLEASLTLSHRESDARATVDRIKARVRTDPDYAVALRRLNRARFRQDLLCGLARALEHKRESLVRLGIRARDEMDQEARLFSHKQQKEEDEASDFRRPRRLREYKRRS